MTAALAVADLAARFGELRILHDVDLEVPFGEMHVLMGPNGSGKSTLCHALMGRPGYEVSGTALVDGRDVLVMDTADRARAGLFEVFQYPVEIPGVTLGELLDEMALNGPDDASNRGREAAGDFGAEEFLERSINVGLSGGEKKRSEMTQLLAMNPRVAILDELDSGLDVDAVRDVAAIVESMRSPGLGILLITHYTRILKYLTVDRVHVMVGGRIVESGGRELADRMDAEGYDELRERFGIADGDGDAFIKGL